MMNEKVEFNVDKIVANVDQALVRKFSRSSLYTKTVAFLIRNIIDNPNSTIGSIEISNTSRIDMNNVSKTLLDLKRKGMLKQHFKSGNLVTYIPVMDKETKLPKILKYYKLVKQTLEI